MNDANVEDASPAQTRSVMRIAPDAAWMEVEASCFSRKIVMRLGTRSHY